MATPAPATLYSLGGIVQWLDESLNNMLLSGVAGNVERITNAIWLPLELGVLIWMIFYGYLISTQQIQTPFGAALWNIVKVVLVVTILEANGFYQTQIMSAMLALPDELVSVVTGSPASARDTLADFHNSGLETATRLDERAPSGITKIALSVLFAIVAFFITIIYTLVTLIGLLMMTVAKVGMTLIVAIGPIFIAALLFEKTKEFFNFWLFQALYFALYGLVFSLVFGVVMGMLGYIQNILFGMTTAPEINILQIFAALFMVCLVAVFLLKLPSVIVSKVTNGASVEMPFIGRI